MNTFTARIRTHYTVETIGPINTVKATPLCRSKPMGGRPNATAAVDCERCIKRAGGAPLAGTEERVEDRVEAAYRELAKSRGDLVSLARLRSRLHDIARADLDKALKAMDRRRQIQLEPDPNRKALPAEAHDAAIRLGGEDKHLLSAPVAAR